MKLDSEFERKICVAFGLGIVYAESGFRPDLQAAYQCFVEALRDHPKLGIKTTMEEIQDVWDIVMAWKKTNV